ncbi:hypothetical protein CP336_12400 [Pseudomonas fluorescens]|nr:hypothetical protein CP336_12400 [Pseudomonas fluorescens]
MYHVIGVCTSKEGERLRTLNPLERIVFRSGHFHSRGYFSLIAPAFEQYAQRDAKIGITSLHAQFHLRNHELDEVLEILNNLEMELNQRPKSWQEYLGTIQYPRQEPRPIQPMLLRRRALRLVGTLRTFVLKAQAQNTGLAYGTGVCYRALCGIELPPGSVYS